MNDKLYPVPGDPNAPMMMMLNATLTFSARTGDLFSFPGEENSKT